MIDRGERIGWSSTWPAVDFIDSTAISALVGVLKRLGMRGEIVHCGLSGSVAEHVRITPAWTRSFRSSPAAPRHRRLLRTVVMARTLRIAVPLLALLLPFQAAAQDGPLPQALQPLAGPP